MHIGAGYAKTIMGQLLGRYPVASTVFLLTFSNLFMTIAWYGHLKNTKSPLLLAIIVSWAIALLEYCFQVPANRIGYGALTLTQLKIVQEVITLVVFTVFAFFVRPGPQVELRRKLSLHRGCRLLRV